MLLQVALPLTFSQVHDVRTSCFISIRSNVSHTELLFSAIGIRQRNQPWSGKSLISTYQGLNADRSLSSCLLIHSAIQQTHTVSTNRALKWIMQYNCTIHTPTLTETLKRGTMNSTVSSYTVLAIRRQGICQIGWTSAQA